MFLLSQTQWLLVFLSAFIVGFSKTGIGGLGILSVLLMASVLPAKESTGIVLPMLVFADIFAIFFYRKFADWTILLRLFPFVIPGIVLGYIFMRVIHGDAFRQVIAVIIWVIILTNLIQKKFNYTVPRKNIWLASVVGLLAGFTTMTSNAAGPIMSVYLLSMNLEKKTFIGSGAWYFFLMNLFKVPFSASLGLITAETIKFNLYSFPVIVAGAFFGYAFV
jgi:hypothetical protein